MQINNYIENFTKKVYNIKVWKETSNLMAYSLIFTLATVLLAIYIFYCKTEDNIPHINKKHTLSIIIVAGLLIRIIPAFFYPGHETDMPCFNAWSDMLKNNGFPAFYTSDSFTDYPPGYMYILYLLGFVKDIFGQGTIGTYVILKLPAIISDILCGVLVYKLCEKYGQKNLKNVLAGFYIFNPTVILNSSIWGQVDSVFTLFVILTLFALTERKMILSYFLFAIAIFIKPQALFYAPVVLFGIIENVFLTNFSTKKLIKNLLGGICAIIFVVILAMPFGLDNVITQYISTIGSYDYVSVNAYNLWTMFGLNWTKLTMPISIIGYTFIVIAVIVGGYIFFTKKSENRYFLTSAFICFAVFVLSVKMHERYAFPVMLLLLCAYAMSSKKEDMYFYVAISALQFLNIFHVLFIYTPETAFEHNNVLAAVIIGLLTLIELVIFVKYIFSGNVKLPKIDNAKYNDVTSKDSKIVLRDIIAIVIITLVYSAVALYNLGDKKAPQTFETINSNASVKLELSEETNISKINIYLGPQHLTNERAMRIKAYDSSGNNTYDNEVKMGSVFYWSSYDVFEKAKYIEISSTDTIYIGEVGIYSDKDVLQQFKNAPYNLIDEQSVVAYSSDYKNSTYFDEIYHARTAYEFLHELPVYEWTHPPLGKTLISLGVSLYGMTPFGWRIMGTLFGILMIPVLYIFTKKMFGTTWISVLSSIIFAFDFMHYSQSRIATIDVYVTFFIMLMYMFMYFYVSKNFKEEKLSNLLILLGLSGLFMGFGIACKWTGVYAGAGLAVIFFASLIFKYRNHEIKSNNIRKSIYFCFGAFVFLPVLIYVLSYIPFIKANNEGFYSIVQNQIDMLSYHGETVVSSSHPFSSPWYQWIVNYRPIWYYSGTNGILTENISAFGNPIVWLLGIIAFLYCVYDTIHNKNLSAAFLVVAYLAQLLPWMFVERTTFIYHYFPCVPFLVLMIAHSFYSIYQKHKIAKPCFIAVTIVAVILFMMFYPVLSGYPVTKEYVINFLKWLPSWQLVG